jgi:aryl-alcohol dehydrogenase-like predicted oxidoreductase
LAKGDKRNNVILATKLGLDMGDGKKGLKAAYVEQAVEDSLRRLQTDFIDLYQAHRDDAETPLEETLGAFDKLVRQGKVRHIGASNYSGPRLKEALRISKDNGLVGYVSIQPQYNLVAREEFETDLLPVVQEHTLGVIPYYSLAAGFLTGKYRSKQDADGKARGGTVAKYLNDWGFNVLHALDEVAREHQSTPGRVALAWLMVQPGVTAPIASATSEKHLTDLIEATKLKLDHASLEKLNTVSAPAAAVKA